MVSFPQVSPPNLMHTSPFLHTCHMPRPSHSSRFYHPHNIGWGVQINKYTLCEKNLELLTAEHGGSYCNLTTGTCKVEESRRLPIQVDILPEYLWRWFGHCYTGINFCCLLSFSEVSFSLYFMYSLFRKLAPFPISSACVSFCWENFVTDRSDNMRLESALTPTAATSFKTKSNASRRI